MNRRFLDLYNRELMHLRKMGADFAKEFPKIAGRLGGIDEFQPCRDPFVERLLEGFAFLTARIQLKIDSEFPTFTQSLLETVYPHYLCPTPSMAVIQFQPDYDEAGLADGFTIPRGSAVYSNLGKNEQTRCEFRTAHNVTLWPVRLTRAKYYTQELASLQLPETRKNVTAGLALRLETTAGLKFSDLKLDTLPIYLMGISEIPMKLYEQIFSDSVAVVIQSASNPGKKQITLDRSCIHETGFDPSEALLPYEGRSFQGYRLLHEYFAFPQRFMYFRLDSLVSALRQFPENQIDIILLFNQANFEMESSLSAENFSLFSTPAINLFEKRADRIHLTDAFSEHHVVADRTRPEDFEIYSVQTVTGIGHQSQEQHFMPFYATRDYMNSENAYFTIHRIPRPASEHEKKFGRRSTKYAGSEVYISLVDASAAPYQSELKQLAMETLCTNRDLPLHMPLGMGKSDFTMEKSAPCTSVRSLGAVSPPYPSFAEGVISWRIINHLSLNYLSLIDAENGSAAKAVRDLMLLYTVDQGQQSAKQISGVTHIHSKPVTRRIYAGGRMAFVRGLEITVTIDETMFIGTGVFLLGSVLNHFFAKYVSLNSFTETVIVSEQRGEIIRWPMKTGLRQIV